MSGELPGPSTRHDGLLDLADEWIVAILRVIHEGWRIAAARHGSDTTPSHEPQMTNRLRSGMSHAVDASWARTRLRIFPGTEVFSAEDAPRAVGLTDISVIVTHLGGHDPHAIIECKRIHADDTKLCRLYVVEGINRYRDGKYGADHTQDFMVGYILQGDIGGAVTGINRYLTRQGRTAESLTDSVALAEPWVRQSCHVRKRSSPVRLHHAFLMMVEDKQHTRNPQHEVMHG